MPLDRRYRLPIRSAYLWLGLWGLWAAWASLDFRDLAAPSLAPAHFAFLAVGFAGNLLMGLGHHLAAHFGLRRPPPAWVLAAESALASSAAAAALVAQAHPAGGWLAPWASWAWAGALALFAAAILAQALRTPVEAANPYRTGGLPGDRTSDLLLWAVAADSALAAVVVALEGMAAPPAVHLWLAGAVATAIFMVVHRVVPRFSRRWLPSWLHAGQGMLAAAGPLLLTAGMQHSPRLAIWGGAVETAAILLYALLVGYGWANRRNRHPALAFPALGALFLLGGVGLGLWFLHDAAGLGRLAVHAVNNLLGFVVLTALGMASAMLGLGVLAAPERPNRRVWRAGLALAAALAAWDAAAWAGLPLAGLLSAVLGVLAIVQARWGIGLPFAGRPLVPRPLAPRPLAPPPPGPGGP